MNAQIKAELDGIFQKERTPLLQAQIELADITDEVDALRNLAARWDAGEIDDEEFGLKTALDSIHARMTRLAEDLFALEVHGVEVSE